jgi:hypothetical protein
MGSKDIHGIVMNLLGALFRIHARPGLTVMEDVYCDLSDATEESLRAPDVVLVGGLSKPKDDFYRGTPILAVEVRATQSKRNLEEKVKLYLEHDWPWIWTSAGAAAERAAQECSFVLREGNVAPRLVPCRRAATAGPSLRAADGIASSPCGAAACRGRAAGDARDALRGHRRKDRLRVPLRRAARHVSLDDRRSARGACHRRRARSPLARGRPAR